MVTAAKLVYPHIEHKPGVRASKACIAGTRIAVVDVALALERGLTPEEIRTHFSSRPLTLAEVHAALAYHYAHPEELADYVRRSQKTLARVETSRVAYMGRTAGR
jgi:uncharacterized protein (DUF433 family)